MSVTIKPNKMKYKDSSGNYVGVNAIAERTTAEEVADIQAVSTTAQGEITALTTAKKTEITNLANTKKTEIDNKATEVTSQLANAAEVRNMLAGTFSTSTNYTKGQYVIQTVTVSGNSVNKLYRFTADHPAGNWLGTDVVEVKLADDVSSLSSAKADMIIVNDNTPTAIMSFLDGADGLPMALKVSVDPVQDLHGYDNPWPAGGGKNLLPMTVDEIKSMNSYGVWSGNTWSYNDIAITILTDSSGNVTGIKLHGTPSSSINFVISGVATLPIGEYVYNIQSTVNIDNFWVSLSSPVSVAIVTKTETSKTVSITGESKDCNAYIYTNAGNTFNNVIIQPMLRLSSVSDATFAPYSNICPISGWTGAKVTRTGKNLATTSIYKQDYVLSDAGAESPSTNFCITDIVPIISESKYICSYTRASSGTDVVRIGFYDADMNFLSRPIFSNSGDAITAPAEAKYARLSYRNVTPDLTNIQLEQGQTATAYQAFGSVNSISWQTEAGTVYGGTLTVNKDGTGSLVVDRAKVTMDSSVDVLRNSDHSFYFSVEFAKKGGIAISDKMKSGENSNADNIFIHPSISVVRFNTKDPFSTGEAARDHFAPMDVVYELDPPVTYAITAPQVKTLLGLNNVWADTGDILSVDYPADTKLYIDGKFASLQALILENISNT